MLSMSRNKQQVSKYLRLPPHCSIFSLIIRRRNITRYRSVFQLGANSLTILTRLNHLLHRLVVLCSRAPYGQTHYYLVIRSMGGILSLLCLCFYVCMVMDFSAEALPICVKFCMVVRPDLRQVFSYFAGIAPGMAKFWASTGRHIRLKLHRI